MDVLACLKRVPETGAKIVLTEDNQEIDTTNLGFTMSPHEECAVEETVQLTEEEGHSTVLTLGPEAAQEQVRTAIAMQTDEGVLLETDGSEWSPRNTAQEIAEFVREREDDYDLLLFGNESADTANHQVGVRVAEELGLPIVTSIKSLDLEDGTAIAKREIARGSEVYEIDLPAVVAVKEGLNEPRYASMRARMQARNQEIERVTAERTVEPGLEKTELESPETDDSEAEVLGESPDAVPAIMDVLRDDLEVI